MQDNDAFIKKVRAAGLLPAGYTDTDTAFRQRIRRIVEALLERRATGAPWPPSAKRIREIRAEVDAGRDAVALEAP